jgi:hypothetical protein
MTITEFLEYVSPYDRIYIRLYDQDGNLIGTGTAHEIDNDKNLCHLSIDTITCPARNCYTIYCK